MKKLKVLMLAATAFAFSAQAQELPAPSPYGEVMQRIGLTDVSVEYSRPGVKGRKIFGNLLKEGTVWRTGANSATKITFSTDATIGGKKIEAGSYSVFTKLSADNWVLLLNKDVKASEGSYSASKDVAKVELKVEKTKATVESMTFSFANVKTNSADLKFEWENSTWSVPIQVESDKMAMENIKNEMKKDKVGFGAYNSSASYYLNNDMDLDKALEWSKKSVEMSPQFYNTITLSKIYAAKGNKKMAIKTAKQSIELAEADGNEAYVNMNKENIAKWSK